MKIKDFKNRVFGILGIAGVFLVGFVFGYVSRENKYIHIEHSDNNILSEKTCEATEQLLLQELEDENSIDWEVHFHNAEVYRKILATGCEENREKYVQKLKRSRRFLLALNPDFVETKDISTCEQIENTLRGGLTCVDGDICADKWVHIENAKIYANLSERGCPENADKYKALAEKELAIARALTDDNVNDYKDETTEIVETYKRIQMQAEAEKMLEKAKKLTNPAIDFIIQLEKIIEE